MQFPRMKRRRQFTHKKKGKKMMMKYGTDASMLDRSECNEARTEDKPQEWRVEVGIVQEGLEDGQRKVAPINLPEENRHLVWV